MRAWKTLVIAISTAALMGLPAQAELPDSLNPLRIGVNVSSTDGRVSTSRTPLLDTETGRASVTLDETSPGVSAVPGLEFDLQVDVEADPRIAYTLTVVNGTDADVDFRIDLSSPLELFDQTSDARHTLALNAVDAGGGGVTVTPTVFDPTVGGMVIQSAFALAVDYVRPPFRTANGPALGDGPLVMSPLSAGEQMFTSGPKAIPRPDVRDVVPENKFNSGAFRAGFRLSAGDQVTLVGEMLIAPDLVGDGGGGGEEPTEPVFPSFIGDLTGRQQIKAKKIARSVTKPFTQSVCFFGDTFEFVDGNDTIAGAAVVKRKGKLIKLSLDESAQAALEALIADRLSAAAGQPVTVELRKAPKGKGAIKRGGAVAKFQFVASYFATMGELRKRGTYKVVVKGAMGEKL